MKPGRTRRPAWSWRGQSSPGACALHADDAAVLDEQPVVGAKAHRRRVDLAPRRRGGEIEQVAAHGDARRGVGGLRAWRSRSSEAWHAQPRAVHDHRLDHDPRADPLLPPRRRRRGRRGRRRRAPCSTGCARTRAAPAPRKAATRATAAPARSSSASCAGRATATMPSRPAPAQRSTPASSSCRRSTARRCSRSRTSPAADGALHPVQQAMVDCHGSQCGFCTPGFVMSLWARLRAPHGARHAADAPAAGRRAVGQPVPLHRLPADPRCRRAHVRPARRAARHRAEVARSAARRLQAAPPIAPAAAPTAPTSARRARSTRSPRCGAPNPRRASLAGSPTSACGSTSSSATCRRLRLHRRRRRAEAHRDRATACCSIGAGGVARRRLARAGRRTGRRWPRSGCASPSLPIRHAGTMGGNVANGSPIGDSAPVLMALDAHLVLRRGERVRRLPLDDFYLGYMKNRLAAGRVRAGDRGAARRAPRRSRAYKISQALRLRHLGACAPASRSSSTAPARSLRRGSPSAAWRPPCKRAAARRGRARRPAVDRGDARGGAGRAGARLQAADRHARQRRLPPAGRAEPAAPLLARDARRRAARRRRARASGAVCAPSAPHASAARQRHEPQPSIRAGCSAPTLPAGARVGVARPHESAHLHVAGEAPYIDDLPELAGTLHAALGLSPVAHGRITGVDLEPDRARCPASSPCSSPPTSPGRTTAARSSTTIRSSPTAIVQYLGQPVFAVIAETRDAARRAAAQAKAALTTSRCRRS